MLAIALPVLAIASAGRSSLTTFPSHPLRSPEFVSATPSDRSIATPRHLETGSAASPFELPLGAERYLDSLPFGSLIAGVGERHGVDPLLIAAVAEAESNFRVDAVSPKGALGLMQLMPFHVESGVEPFDPEANLELGAALLADLSERYDGELDLALAAYHAGPGAVERFGGLPPYRSTERYVERVLEIYLAHYSRIVEES